MIIVQKCPSLLLSIVVMLVWLVLQLIIISTKSNAEIWRSTITIIINHHRIISPPVAFLVRNYDIPKGLSIYNFLEFPVIFGWNSLRTSSHSRSLFAPQEAYIFQDQLGKDNSYPSFHKNWKRVLCSSTGKADYSFMLSPRSYLHFPPENRLTYSSSLRVIYLSSSRVGIFRFD